MRRTVANEMVTQCFKCNGTMCNWALIHVSSLGAYVCRFQHKHGVLVAVVMKVHQYVYFNHCRVITNGYNTSTFICKLKHTFHYWTISGQDNAHKPAVMVIIAPLSWILCQGWDNILTFYTSIESRLCSAILIHLYNVEFRKTYISSSFRMFLDSCDKVYHKQELCFLLYILLVRLSPDNRNPDPLSFLPDTEFKQLFRCRGWERIWISTRTWSLLLQ